MSSQFGFLFFFNAHIANKEMFLKKDSGVLARAGFSYETSMEVLNIDKKELKILEKKL